MRPGLFTSLSGLFRLSQAVLDLLGLCDDRLRPSGLREDRVPAGAKFSRVSSALALCRSGDFELLLSAIPSGDLDLLGPRSGDSELLLQLAICGLERSSILDVSESSTACSATRFVCVVQKTNVVSRRCLSHCLWCNRQFNTIQRFRTNLNQSNTATLRSTGWR